MEIKYKLYPYPVLTPYSNDFKNGTFDVAIDVVRDGYDLRIDFLAELTSQSLQTLIKQGIAKYAYHLECAQTGFRKVIQTSKISETYTLTSKLVNGKLQICPFIIAADDIKAYTSPDFHEDYQDVSFEVEAGCVMATGKMVTVDISKDIDDLVSTPSIFNIIRNPDADCKQMLVDTSQKKIIIKLPLDDFYRYKAMSNDPLVQPVLNSLTVVPALVHVLGELKALPIQERSENSDSSWYKVLNKVLLTQFDCDIESEGFNNQDILVLAQKLIDNPITDAFKFLTSSFETSGGNE